MIFALNRITVPGFYLQNLITKVGLSLCLTIACAVVSAAEWNTITHSDMDSNTTTSVAIIENDDGYTLEVYKDSVNAVRARFTLAKELISFPKNFCPTFQIDNGQPKNRSINDAPCLADKTWAEFILGYIESGQVTSSAIAGIMNGVSLKLRFMLENGDYRETLFSLRGSKRAMSAALGAGISVSPIN
ncbi:MAG: hypothetical protein GKR93_08325 [Gammaproteobacteria bacterium]|nr:hypothetical protein [Gammaproteobacteria bacterium]